MEEMETEMENCNETVSGNQSAWKAFQCQWRCPTLRRAILLIMLGLMAVAGWVFIFGESNDYRDFMYLNFDKNGSYIGGAPAVLLFWSTYFQTPWEETHFWKTKYHDRCPEVKCILTTDRSRLKEAHAVIFHGRDIDSKDLPKERLWHQRWVYMFQESPSYSSSIEPMLNELFNWTMTYHRNSDIFGRYGDLAWYSSLENNSEEDSKKNYASGKTKMAMWIVSRCDTKSRREVFAEELRKHGVAIDIYGSCGNLTCLPKFPREICFERLEKDYKFYLSFENSLCEDYITEKFFNALRYKLVPVAFGGGGYEALAPAGSYVDALNFTSVKALAEYLIVLDKNDTLYNRYFDWKRGKEIQVDATSHSVCDLCKKVLDPQLPPKVYRDLNHWRNENGKCRYWNDDALISL